MIRVNLAELLFKKKWSQRKLAEKTGIRANTIFDLYHGYATGIKFKQLESICNALECNINDLLEIIPNKEK